MKQHLLIEGKRYSFSDYFNMSATAEEISQAFEYRFQLTHLVYPHNLIVDPSLVEKIQSFYYRLRPRIKSHSEIAKREFMIAPLLHEIILAVEADLNIEYPIDIDNYLNGVIDYVLQSTEKLIVIEAKKGDLDRGFNQLMVEMIALDHYEIIEQPPIIYGALTIGEVWRFAQLERQEKRITQDLNLFRFPQDVEALLAIFLGILKPQN